MLMISCWSPAVVAAMVPDDFVVLLLPETENLDRDAWLRRSVRWHGAINIGMIRSTSLAIDLIRNPTSCACAAS